MLPVWSLAGLTMKIRDSPACGLLSERNTEVVF
jgi:hypothetical protein